MKNLTELVKQAQDVQSRMGAVQEKLAALEFEGVSGGGMVRLFLSGKHELKRLSIDPSIAGEAEILEDLLVAAHADAKAKVDVHVNEQMQSLTGGLSLPSGFKLPF